MGNQKPENASPENEGRGLTLLFGYKMLVFMICLVLFVMLSTLVFTIFADEVALADAELITEAMKTFFVALVIFFLAIALLAVYVIFALWHEKEEEHPVCIFLEKASNVLEPLFLLSVVVLLSLVLTKFSLYPMTTVMVNVVFAVASFLPLLVVRNVNDEQRVKNFMDAMARTCTCLAFFGGCMAFIIKMVLGG